MGTVVEVSYLKAEMRVRVRRGRHLRVGRGVHPQHQARELEHSHAQTVALHMHMPQRKRVTTDSMGNTQCTRRSSIGYLTARGQERERPRGGEGEAKGRRGYLAARGQEVFEGAQGGGQQGAGGAAHLGHQPSRALLHLV